MKMDQLESSKIIQESDFQSGKKMVVEGENMSHLTKGLAIRTRAFLSIMLLTISQIVANPSDTQASNRKNEIRNVEKEEFDLMPLVAQAKGQNEPEIELAPLVPTKMEFIFKKLNIAPREVIANLNFPEEIMLVPRPILRKPKSGPTDKCVSKQLSELRTEEGALKEADWDPSLTLECAEVYMHQSWAREVVMRAADWDPQSALEFAILYKSEPWAKEVVLKAVKRNPIAAIRFKSNYKDQSWANEIVGTAKKLKNEALDKELEDLMTP